MYNCVCITVVEALVLVIVVVLLLLVLLLLNFCKNTIPVLSYIYLSHMAWHDVDVFQQIISAPYRRPDVYIIIIMLYRAATESTRPPIRLSRPSTARHSWAQRDMSRIIINPLSIHVIMYHFSHSSARIIL